MYSGHSLKFARYCGCCGVVGVIVVVVNSSVMVVVVVDVETYWCYGVDVVVSCM